MPALLDAALAYAARGWPVLALSPGSKVPLKDQSLQPHGVLSASADPPHVRELWGLYPLANVGIATGPASGVTVLDLDGPHAPGLLKAAGLKRPATHTVKTPHGEHLYIVFDPAVPQGAAFLKADCDCVKKCQVDTRNTGGYAVAPPSTVEGFAYTTVREGVIAWPEVVPVIQSAKAAASPDAAPLLDHPGWVAALLLSGAPEGQRNDAATRLAGYFRSLNLPQDIALAAMRQFADACTPPLHWDELKATLASVWRYLPSKPAINYQDRTAPAAIMDATSQTRRKFFWPEPNIEVNLDHLRVRDDGVHCWITISVNGDEIYGPLRLNLLSESGREGLRRALRERKEHDWQAVIDQIARRTVRSFDTATPRVDASTYVVSRPQPWLIYPFVRAQQPTVIYADSGKGKSTLAIALCIALATGKPFLPGVQIGQAAPTYYADWETDADDGIEVAQLIARGAGLVLPKNGFTYRRFSGPLPEHTDTILADMADLGAKMLVVDSAIVAAGDDAHGPDAPRLHYNALRQVGAASISLTHIPSQSERMYGNVFWRNLARVAWFMQSEQDEGSRSATLGLYQRKGNRGMLSKPVGMQVTFGDSMITYAPANVADSPTLAENLSHADRISHCLASGAASTSDIAEETGLSEETVRAVLNKRSYRGKLWLKTPSGLWGLLARETSYETSSVTRTLLTGERGPVTPQVPEEKDTDGKRGVPSRSPYVEEGGPKPW